MILLLGIFGTLVAIFFFQVLAVFASRVSKRTFYDVLPFLHPDNPGYLEELFDSGKEAALADALGRKRFRRAQIKRIRLALEWLGRRATNAASFQDWGAAEAKRTGTTGNLEVRAAAEELEAACSSYRMAAGVVQRQLQRWLLRLFFLPFSGVPFFAPLKTIESFDLLLSYEKIEEAAVKLAHACGGDYYDLLVEAL
ncbi:MAG TPA: hypothetical protein VNW97_09225 [Candidatus Saccharimonadales bacterium]|jgi:hypothetical protein|nr:hypothetical protein [Candidatus Saccharimonadales bacterium]